MVLEIDPPRTGTAKRRRLRRIYRRWRRAPSHPLRINWWEEPPLRVAGRLGVWVGGVAGVALIPFSAAILPLGADSKLPTPEVTLLPFRPGILALLLLYGCFHGWLIDRHLSLRTPDERRVRAWARAVRCVAGGIPLLGHYAIPGWRWILEHRQEWVLGEKARSSRLLALSSAGAIEAGLGWRSSSWLRTFADRAIRTLTGQIGLGFLLLSDAVVVLFALFGETTASPGSGQRMAVAGLGLAFHILAALAVGVGFYDEARRSELSRFQVGIHVVPAVLWLIPIPYLALSGLLIFLIRWLIADRTSQEMTLVHGAFAEQGSRLPSGQALEEVVRRGWRVASFSERLRQPGGTFPPAVEQSYAQDRLFWLYRTKSIALAFDALFVGWLAARLGSRRPGWRPSFEKWSEVVIDVSFGLCLLGAAIMVAYFAALAFRTLGPFGQLDEHPYAQYLAGGHLGFLAGLSIGPHLFYREAAAVAETLQAIGVLGCLGFFAAFLLRIFVPGGERTRGPFQGMLGLLGFLTIGLAGQSMEQESWFADGLMSWSIAFAWTFWCWHLLIGVAFLRWVLRPFEWHHLSCPKIPVSVRRWLGFLAVTVVLPFGGLAIPAWIYLRHRKLPEWESRYYE